MGVFGIKSSDGNFLKSEKLSYLQDKMVITRKILRSEESYFDRNRFLNSLFDTIGLQKAR